MHKNFYSQYSTISTHHVAFSISKALQNKKIMNLLELKINQTIKINSKWELQKGVEKSGRKVTIIFTGRF